MSKADYTDGHWTSADGLKLHFRDYAGRQDRPPLLCIPGLTRNARDFEPLADAFAGEWRVICLELRGRGDSDYARDSDSYTPASYVEDIAALLEQEALEKVVAIGTSLGGIVSLMLGVQEPTRFAGLVLNDIGPDIQAEGLERIREYVGQGRSFPTWVHAARALKEQAGSEHPDYELSDWLKLSKRLMCIGHGGRIAWDYDMRIAEPFANLGPQDSVDMWPALRRLAGRPMLVLRGELSDVLSARTVARMEQEIEGLESVTIPRTGHAPTLEEPEAQSAIARMLGRVA